MIKTDNLNLNLPGNDDKVSIAQLNENFQTIDDSFPFKLGIDADGNYGYYKDGADTVTPFNSGGVSGTGIPYVFSFNDLTFDGSSQANYYTTGTLKSMLIDGNVPCSVEASYNSKQDTGYIFGIGYTQNNSTFSFTPSKFVGYSEDHDFAESYSGKHHIVLSYDGNKSVALYIDGELKETITLTNVLSFNAYYVFAGHWMALPGTEQFNGTIKYARLYKKELSSDEVSALYNHCEDVTLEPNQVIYTIGEENYINTDYKKKVGYYNWWTPKTWSGYISNGSTTGDYSINVSKVDGKPHNDALLLITLTTGMKVRMLQTQVSNYIDMEELITTSGNSSTANISLWDGKYTVKLTVTYNGNITYIININNINDSNGKYNNVNFVLGPFAYAEPTT